MKCISEKDYLDEMEHTVLPFLEDHKISGTFRITDSGRQGRGLFKKTDTDIYFESYRLSRSIGTVVISHGFSESIQKYKEMIYYFLKAGYQVFLADHRGHGYSGRSTKEPYLVETRRFDDYVSDLHTFFTTIVKPASGDKPCFLLGHSMGGAIAASYIEMYPADFSKAVLTAPMMRMRTGKIAEPLAFLISAFMKFTGRGGQRVAGQPRSLEHAEFSSSSALSEPRFLWYLQQRRKDPQLQTVASTYDWLFTAIPATHRITSRRRCRNIQIPVLLFLAGKDALVKPSGIRLFAHQVRDIRLCRVSFGKHELFSMTAQDLEKYYGRILRFFRE